MTHSLMLRTLLGVTLLWTLSACERVVEEREDVREEVLGGDEDARNIAGELNREWSDENAMTSNPDQDVTLPDGGAIMTRCGVDEYVHAQVCAPCPEGTTNDSGDIVSEGDSDCDPVYCDVDEYVIDHTCAPCAEGAVNQRGDDASGRDTVCESPHAIGHPTFFSPHVRPIDVVGDYVYVTNTPADTIDVFQRDTQALIRRIHVGVDPVSLTPRPDGLEV